MTSRRLVCAIALALIPSVPAVGAEYETANFVVSAATKELARSFGEYAEKYRKEKALEWLGAEMPNWPEKCPLQVKVSMGQTGGATTFTFGSVGRRPAVMSQEMKIFGTLDQLLYSVLPHEVTHTVLAHNFGQAVPRWADEGGSVLSENDDERFNHDVRCREVLNQGRGIPLRVLFTLKEYPRDMIVLYAQGYSITQYLVDHGGRQKFLRFVGIGMRGDSRNWDEAVRSVYGDKFEGVDDLQQKWIAALRTPPQRVAARTQNPTPAAPAARLGSADATVATTAGAKAETRSSAMTGFPELEPPVVARGAAPAGSNEATFGKLPTPGGERPAMSPAAASATPRPPLPRDFGLLPPEPPVRR